MRRFIESMDEPTTINRPDGGGVIDLREPHVPMRNKDDDMKAATPLVWLCVVALVLCIAALVVNRFIN